MRHPLFPIAIVLAAVLAGLCFLVLLADAVVRAYTAARERRRQRLTGVYGVVVDADGRVVGTYLDPFATRARPARVHDAGSPWAEAAAGPEGRAAWAWEGFGHSEAEARFHADRLRQRHLRLFPWLAGEEDGEPEYEPWRG